MNAIENNLVETLDEDDDDVVNYIEITEDSFGVLSWDSNIEDLGEFLQMLQFVYNEAQKPQVEVFTLH